MTVEFRDVLIGKVAEKDAEYETKVSLDVFN